jgi:hypothetical protein
VVINNAINSPLPTSLALGGTNANLTPSNGGIFYSTATAGAILAGTPTGSQSILSGSSTSPIWSTATYPSITIANQLLYSSSDNIIEGLPTANNASLVLDETGVPVWSLPMTDGQVMIGGTNGRPEPFNLTEGTNVIIKNGPGSITINSGLGANWVWIATQTASGGASLSFNNLFSSSYVAYRLVLDSLLPAVSATQLHLLFGTGSGTYITTPSYIFQLFDVNSFFDPGNFYYSQTGATEVLLSYGNAYGITIAPSYGGISGTVDLFVTSGSINVANGISRTAYASYDSFFDQTSYINSTCTFQIPADNYTSVQLYVESGTNIASGSAYLYGLTV